MSVLIQALGATALGLLNGLLVYWLYRVHRDYRDELACRALVERVAALEERDRERVRQLDGLRLEAERLSLRVRAFAGGD